MTFTHHDSRSPPCIGESNLTIFGNKVELALFCSALCVNWPAFRMGAASQDLFEMLHQPLNPLSLSFAAKTPQGPPLAAIADISRQFATLCFCLDYADETCEVETHSYFNGNSTSSFAQTPSKLPDSLKKMAERWEHENSEFFAWLQGQGGPPKLLESCVDHANIDDSMMLAFGQAICAMPISAKKLGGSWPSTFPELWRLHPWPEFPLPDECGAYNCLNLYENFIAEPEPATQVLFARKILMIHSKNAREPEELSGFLKQTRQAPNALKRFADTAFRTPSKAFLTFAKASAQANITISDIYSPKEFSELSKSKTEFCQELARILQWGYNEENTQIIFESSAQGLSVIAESQLLWINSKRSADPVENDEKKGGRRL